MSVIKDSSAIIDEDRILSQHQAALTIIQSRLQNPEVRDFSWLDLACGKGQIIVQLDRNLSHESRRKVEYHLYDVKAGYVTATQRRAEVLGFRAIHSITDLISRLDTHYPNLEHFDFITFTNTVHEISPVSLSNILVNCILRLKPRGALYIYDFEKLPPNHLELGAVAWTRGEMQEIIRALLGGLGVADYMPEVGQWRHTTSFGWNIHLERDHLRRDIQDLQARAPEAVRDTQECLRTLLARKFEQCKQMLASFTEQGLETEEENNDKLSALYNLWALLRATEQQL